VAARAACVRPIALILRPKAPAPGFDPIGTPTGPSQAPRRAPKGHSLDISALSFTSIYDVTSIHGTTFGRHRALPIGRNRAPQGPRRNAGTGTEAPASASGYRLHPPPGSAPTSRMAHTTRQRLGLGLQPRPRLQATDWASVPCLSRLQATDRPRLQATDWDCRRAGGRRPSG
jgi:hypothetical protein